ncbi:2Fe-2S iron-sulfur cluster binding domain-containing protein [Crenobacter sp. SG2303]|uniref:2Fe-2S iron-sulfur cluster binding domain-containing protein n=1 Tax=Crenobacter oryzisoli TaxID=3056844 RepID=A0ABT7XNH3_9NEIS|nr:2Fe-2S iron-sulfur cluster binding domain-containing protein [Crenobacter sp. SG2303]MDN0075342.1 2Fe-2S iron-sulfur cluster binding domain-containing protein [Crenobacter sp. SG2303]
MKTDKQQRTSDHRLTIEPLGQTIDVEEDQTLLAACLRNGVWLPHACGHGLCGICKVQTLDGDLEHGEASPFSLMDFERDEGKCLACCATMMSDMTIEADIEPAPDAQYLPLMDFTASVSRIEDLPPTIKGGSLPSTVPNRCVSSPASTSVNLWIGDETTPRAFSIASAPSAGEIELNIRHVPIGKVTSYIHGQLAVSEEVRLPGPLGRFFVRKSDPRPLLFMAGGSGLSNPRSMILDLLESGDSRPITLIQGTRNGGELYYRAEFKSLAERHANFHYLPVLSGEADDSGWSGDRGYVHELAARHYNHDFRGWRAYLCEPPPMIEACIATLMQGRLFEKDIFTEKFLSAADASQGTRSPLFRSL